MSVNWVAEVWVRTRLQDDLRLFSIWHSENRLMV